MYGVMRKENYMSSRIKNVLKAITIFIIVLIITYINDEYVRAYFHEYNKVLRLVDHILSGVAFPLILYLLGLKIHYACFFYLVWCTHWEMGQYLERGYFQYFQFMSDIMGMGVAACVYKIDKIRVDK